MDGKVGFGLIILSITLVVFISGCLEKEVSPTPNEKLGLSITPIGIEPENHYHVTYQAALEMAKKGRFKTLWFPVLWEWIEQSPGVYNFGLMDNIILPAHDEEFDVGARVMFIATGNDPEGNFSSVLQIPDHVNPDISSQEFKTSFGNFYKVFAEHYKGKVRYISIANSINNYFEQFPEGEDNFDHFMIAYDKVVDEIHRVDPNMIVMPDLDFGGIYSDRENSRERFLEPFLSTESDAIGFIAYFVEEDIYGELPESMIKVLDEMDEMTEDKEVYLLETAMFSKPPSNEDLQSDYVKLILVTVPRRDFIMGMAWFVLYDSRDLPDVSWDFKGGFGLFGEYGNPKKGWETWLEYSK